MIIRLWRIYRKAEKLIARSFLKKSKEMKRKKRQLQVKLLALVLRIIKLLFL